MRDEIVQYIKDEKIGRGITLMEDYKRYYPYGTTASTVLGFTGTDNQGLAGIETEYDSELSGTAGRLVSAKNAQGDDMPFQYDQYVQAQDGYDLVLTIDETAQSIVEKHLQAGLEACGALEGGTAVLMNVKTGAILALSTKGDYDPNDPFTISQEAEDAIPEKVEDALKKAQEKEQQELNTLQLAIDNAETDEARAEAKKALADYERIDVTTLRDELTDQMWGEAQNKQWRNKAVSDTYYPGSVFKMVTGSMAMESGVASEDSTYTCTGQWVFDDSTIDPISCWYHAGHGTETLVDGICNSCNPYMIWLGQKMGRHTFFNFFEAFGFTQRTGIDLPGEADSLYFSEDELNIVELATSSFGQNFSITPIQMITAIAAVANGGYLVQPHVVDRMLDSDGNIVKTTDTSYKRQVISEDVSKRMTAILQKNATSESGKNGYVAGYRVAGKTGTSEKVALYYQDLAEGNDRGMQYVVSYGGYAPADDPQYALLVFYDEPQIGGASGGTQAGPIFAAIMEEVLPYLGVDPQYTEAEYENLSATAPNVIGMTMAEAKSHLEEQGFGGTGRRRRRRRRACHGAGAISGRIYPEGRHGRALHRRAGSRNVCGGAELIGYDIDTCRYFVGPCRCAGARCGRRRFRLRTKSGYRRGRQGQARLRHPHFVCQLRRRRSGGQHLNEQRRVKTYIERVRKEVHNVWILYCIALQSSLRRSSQGCSVTSWCRFCTRSNLARPFERSAPVGIKINRARPPWAASCSSSAAPSRRSSASHFCG